MKLSINKKDFCDIIGKFSKEAKEAIYNHIVGIQGDVKYDTENIEKFINDVENSFTIFYCLEDLFQHFNIDTIDDMYKHSNFYKVLENDTIIVEVNKNEISQSKNK
jgi:hypothetical protein